MQYRVLLTDKAEADVESVLEWFSDQQATDPGGRWFAQLMARLNTLELHPEGCSLAAESEDLKERPNLGSEPGRSGAFRGLGIIRPQVIDF